jgi:hypothetical protein
MKQSASMSSVLTLSAHTRRPVEILVGIVRRVTDFHGGRAFLKAAEARGNLNTLHLI